MLSGQGDHLPESSFQLQWVQSFIFQIKGISLGITDQSAADEERQNWPLTQTPPSQSRRTSNQPCLITLTNCEYFQSLKGQN